MQAKDETNDIKKANERLTDITQALIYFNNSYYPLESKRTYIKNEGPRIKKDLSFIEDVIKKYQKNEKAELIVLEENLATQKKAYEEAKNKYLDKGSSNNNQPLQENTFASILKKFDQFKEKRAEDLKEKHDNALDDFEKTIEESKESFKTSTILLVESAHDLVASAKEALNAHDFLTEHDGVHARVANKALIQLKKELNSILNDKHYEYVRDLPGSKQFLEKVQTILGEIEEMHSADLQNVANNTKQNGIHQTEERDAPFVKIFGRGLELETIRESWEKIALAEEQVIKNRDNTYTTSVKTLKFNREILEYEKAIADLITARENYRKDFSEFETTDTVLGTTRGLIVEIQDLREKEDVSTKELTEILKSTTNLLNGDMSAEEYQKDAQNRQRKSAALKTVGGLMIVLGTAALFLGAALVVVAGGILTGRIGLELFQEFYKSKMLNIMERLGEAEVQVRNNPNSVESTLSEKGQTKENYAEKELIMQRLEVSQGVVPQQGVLVNPSNRNSIYCRFLNIHKEVTSTPTELSESAESGIIKEKLRALKENTDEEPRSSLEM